MSERHLYLPIAFLSSLASVACSSAASNSSAPRDAGSAQITIEAGADAATGADATAADATAADATAADAAPPPLPEPPWSGTTVEPGCTVNGCIRAFGKKTTYSKGILFALAASGNAVLNGVVEYAITYVSDGAEITGSVFVPDTAPPAGGYAVVVMNQPTSGVAPACAPSLGELAMVYASPTAVNGFVTIVPDATSYGTPPYGAYIEGPIAGRAALDAARAAFHTAQALGQPIARKAVIAGLSQGAYSTMAAATEYPTYANELEIRGFAAAEPPSNLRRTTNSDIVTGQASLVFDALRIWSWQGLLKLSGGQIFAPPYDTMAPGWFESDCVRQGNNASAGTLSNDFLEPVPDGGTPTTPVPASVIFSPAFLAYAQNDSWPADWGAEYEASLTVPSRLALPVLIFEGTADTTVLPADVDAYVVQLQAAGVSVDYRHIAGGTHENTALSSFTTPQLANDQAVAWIMQTLAN